MSGSVTLYSTLYLTPGTWDLTLDSNGSIAVASPPYSLAQDAASAIKTFIGEVWYNTTLGVPYWGNILGEWPALQYVKAQLADAALTVPGVVAAQVFISSTAGRKLAGQVQITDVTGAITAASF